jgi:uncharacterized protein (UPF0335 family)
MSKQGHNSGPVRADRLKSFVERIEKLEEERKAIGGDIRDVYAELKGVGYDVKTTRKVVALRQMDAAARAEQEALLDVYKHALGMAVELVGSGLSLREAARATGASKSSIHRALAVPAASHDPDTGEITKEQGDRQSSLRDGEASADERDASASPSPPEPSPDLPPTQASEFGVDACPIPAEPDLTIPPFLRRVA